jgi:DNA-binding transcriptional ArsR family regulator
VRVKLKEVNPIRGSVGRHLKILLDARLIQRRRAGRSVVHFRTQPGDTLANAQPTSF